MGAATPTGARVSRLLAQAPGPGLCRFGFRDACARARRCAAWTHPRGAALSARHQIGNQTLTGLRVSCSGPWTQSPARKGGGAVNSPAPVLPCPAPRHGGHLPLGPASGCRRASGARPPRALPGEKEKPCRRSARAPRRLLCGERQAARPGRGGRRTQGGPGRRGRNVPNSGAWLRGGPGMQAGELPVGAALLAKWGGGGAPVPPASTIVWAPGSPLAPPPRLSAPHSARLPPGERAEGAAGAESERDAAASPGSGGRRWARGKGEVRAEWGRGQVTAEGGGRPGRTRGGRKWGGSQGGGRG